MTGPYVAEIRFGDRYTQGAPDMVLSWDENRDDLKEGNRIAYKFYRSGGGATMVGTGRAATFFIASLLEPGEEACVDIFGRNVADGDDHAPTHAGAYVRRDAAGRVFSTLGSRWARERQFVGV